MHILSMKFELAGVQLSNVIADDIIGVTTSLQAGVTEAAGKVLLEKVTEFATDIGLLSEESAQAAENVKLMNQAFMNTFGNGTLSSFINQSTTTFNINQRFIVFMLWIKKLQRNKCKTPLMYQGVFLIFRK